MKKLYVLFMLLMAPAVVHAGSWDLSLGKGFTVGISTSLNDTYVMGGYDVHNREPVAGYGKELFPIKKDGVELAYISGTHLFAMGEEGRGAFCIGAGVRPVSMLNTLATGVGYAGKLLTLPKWAGTVDKFMSVEIDYGRRDLFGSKVTPGKYADLWIIGGQINMPIQDFFAIFSK